MKIPSSPRYKFATHMALETFTYFNVLSFPIGVKALIKSEGIRLKKYSTIAKRVGISLDEVCKEYQTDLAYIFRQSSGEYAIAYNDTKPEYVIRFSLAHELGHYALMHLEDFDETILRYRGNGLVEKKYQVLEKEANCFARNLVSPAPVADVIPQEMYQLYFGIGYGAEQTRINLLRSDKYYTKLLNSDIGKKHFSRLRRRISHTHKCLNCKACVVRKKINFCPICQSDELKKLDLRELMDLERQGKIMKYSSIELGENKFPIRCPRCENEDINSSEKFCPICCTYLKNICIGKGPFYEDADELYPSFPIDRENNGCGKELIGSARYCSDCGGISSYFNQGLLSFWVNEKEKYDILGEMPF
ncbi:TPA: ImmA/IrrE family metallo-endopeptidase [Streptococcus equi subsp. zooepidemicus]|nr:ImmA/IrrE family metallo-endopeptidase [Streptococcus equi subsp. zooepidemicus]